ncbi:hypothetical protein WME76_28560 [Sorangium sp. So ce119]|uniref:hypothetical protein n=1 Tax=Sorangium sp. So ce119 TaxID=3133279 RepID=UPI003F5FF1ED
MREQARVRAAMPRPSRPLQALLSAAVAGGALVVAGCPSPDERACDAVCDCTGCSEARYLECLDEAETTRKAAAEASCAGALDELLVCLEEELECKDDVFFFDGCEDQEARLGECGISVFRTACELANDRLTECGQGAPLGTDPASCIGQTECNARCIAETSCAGLNGLDPEENVRFGECTNLCFFQMP